MVDNIVIVAYNDIFVVFGFLFQHLTLSNLKTAFDSINHLLVLTT